MGPARGRVPVQADDAPRGAQARTPLMREEPLSL